MSLFLEMSESHDLLWTIDEYPDKQTLTLQWLSSIYAHVGPSIVLVDLLISSKELTYTCYRHRNAIFVVHMHLL